MPLSSIVSVSKPGFGVTVAIQAVPIAVPNQLTISGNGLTQGIADTGAVLNTGGDNTWSGNISLGIVPGFSPSNPPTGDVAIGAAGGSTLNVTGTVDGLQELGANQTGAIGANNGSTSQEMGLSKVGSGTLFLGNANQFSGGVIVSQGNLVIGNSQGLGTHPTVDPDLATVEQIVVLSPDQMGTVTLGFSGQTTKTGYGPGGTAPTAAGMAQTLNGLFASAGYVGVNVNVEETSIPTSTQDVTTGVTNPIGGELFTVTFSDPGDPLAFSSTPLTANGTEGVVAGASFVTQPSTDVYVATSAELDLTNNVDIVGHTVTLNGSGVNGSNGALESVGGDNTWDGPISIETGPLSNTAASIGASSGTSLTLAGSFVDTPALDNGGLSLGGAPVSPTATGGGGSIIFPQGTSLALPIYLTGGNTQIDSTAGFANDTFYLEGGALSGLGTVGPIVDGSIDGGGIIDSGDNADSALVNGSLFFPNEFNNLNTVGTLTTNTNLTLTFNDTYDAYIGDPTQPNSSTLLSVEGTLTILSDSSAGAVLAGYVDSTYTTTSPPVEIITASGGISGTFVNEAASPPTSDPGAPTQVGLNAITVAFIGNEEFYVDYYNTSIYVHRVAETVTISALTPSVPPGAPLSVSPPPPATSNVIQTATVDYGEDVQAYVDLYTTSSFVNLTGSTAIFQLVTPAGVPYQYISVPVTYVSPGVYMAEIDLPDNLASPLNVTTTANPMTPYVVSVFYDGGFSNGEAIFAADSVSDGTVIGHTATTEAYQQLNVAVSPTPTTTNLTVTPAAANNTYGYGADLTFTATVAGAITLAQQPNPADVSPPVATPAGTVDFYDTPLGGTKTLIAAVPVTNGVATFTDPFLPEGEHSIYAVYVSQSSPEDYIGSTSNTLPTITINQAVTTTTLSVGNTPINYNNTERPDGHRRQRLRGRGGRPGGLGRIRDRQHRAWHRGARQRRDRDQHRDPEYQPLPDRGRRRQPANHRRLLRGEQQLRSEQLGDDDPQHHRQPDQQHDERHGVAVVVKHRSVGDVHGDHRSQPARRGLSVRPADRHGDLHDLQRDHLHHRHGECDSDQRGGDGDVHHDELAHLAGRRQRYGHRRLQRRRPERWELLRQQRYDHGNRDRGRDHHHAERDSQQRGRPPGRDAHRHRRHPDGRGRLGHRRLLRLRQRHHDRDLARFGDAQRQRQRRHHPDPAERWHGAVHARHRGGLPGHERLQPQYVQRRLDRDQPGHRWRHAHAGHHH